MNFEDWKAWAITGVASAAGYIWRNVILHDKKLDLLERDFKHGKEHRERQDEEIKEIRKTQEKAYELLQELKLAQAKATPNYRQSKATR